RFSAPTSSSWAWPSPGCSASASTLSSGRSRSTCTKAKGGGPMRRLPALAVLLISAFLVLPADRGGAQGAGPRTVRFGVQPSTQPPYIAREAGFFKEIEDRFKTKIEFITFPFGGPQNVAFAAGELDFSQKGMAPCAVAMQRGKAKLLLVNILEQTAIIGQPDLKGVTELKGKKVAHHGQGSQQYPLLLLALDSAGMNADDVDIITM